MEIELIDLRSVVRLAQFFEAHRAERGDAEQGPVFGSRSRDGALTLVMEETLQGGWRAVHRQCQPLPHDGNGEINVLDAAQDVRH